MKFIITKTELDAMVRRQYNFPESVTVVVSNAAPKAPKAPVLSPELSKLVAFVDTNRQGNKITAIKEIRAVTGLGLFEAKGAVEQWSVLRPFIFKLGRFPDYRPTERGNDWV